ncbi:hypothetical protein [Lunatibacter salilacus]|uniref:hypothetical protein n=1 Tax=Lunatibacter salilacus TaxID=2483804 RepID=UPI00131DB052|nr:hypothetical protein [Lunatibacter salilacus]
MRELDIDLGRRYSSNICYLRVCLVCAVIFALLSLTIFYFAWMYPWIITNNIFPDPASDYVTSFAQVLGAIAGVLFLYAAFLGQQQQIIIQQQEIRSQSEFNNRTINNQYFFELLNRLTVVKTSLFITRLEPNSDGVEKEFGDNSFYYYMNVYLRKKFVSKDFPKDGKALFTKKALDGVESNYDPEFLTRNDLKFIFDNCEKIFGIDGYLKIFRAIVSFLKLNKMDDYLSVLEGSLSGNERLFLFYSILVEMEDLEIFLTERQFLKDIDRNFLLHQDNYYILYSKK